MHPITAETSFSRLWPGSNRRPALARQEPTIANRAETPPRLVRPDHDFLVVNPRPDLVTPTEPPDPAGPARSQPAPAWFIISGEADAEKPAGI